MRTLRIVAACLLLAACGSDTTAPNSGPVVTGTWNLRSVNGTSLPFAFAPSQGTTTTITASVLTISVDGTYNEVLNIRFVNGATVTTTTATEVGTWTGSGGSITFHNPTNNATYQGSVSGSTLTEINSGYTQVYGR
jgi:hypothetical protein